MMGERKESLEDLIEELNEEMTYHVIEVFDYPKEEFKSKHPNIQEAITTKVNWQYHNPGHMYIIRAIKEY